MYILQLNFDQREQRKGEKRLFLHPIYTWFYSYTSLAEVVWDAFGHMSFVV